MSAFYFFLITIPFLALSFLVYRALKNRQRGQSPKKVLLSQLAGFALILILTSALTFSVSAASEGTQAQEPQEETVAVAGNNSLGLCLIAAAVVTGLAGIGGGIAVAAGAPAAIAATSEDPKSFGKSLIFVALGESIALYGVVISILILNKL